MKRARFRRKLAAMLGVCLLTLALFPAALAAAQQVATVDLVGVVVLRVREPVGGFSPHERANIIYQRLNRALSAVGENVSPSLVNVRTADGTPMVYLGPYPIVSADSAHAALNGTTPEGLAQLWAANLREALLHFQEVHDLQG